MTSAAYDVEDFKLLSSLLEKEKVVHSRRVTLCFVLLIFSVILFLLSLLLLAKLVFDFVTADVGKATEIISVLGIVPVAGVMFLAYSSWCAALNCVNTIERSLLAARAGRWRLFNGFVREMKCTDDKKRNWLLEIAGALMN